MTNNLMAFRSYNKRTAENEKSAFGKAGHDYRVG